MCGRFTMTTPDFELVCAMIGVYVDPAIAKEYRPRWNVAPTDTHIVVRGGPSPAALEPHRTAAGGSSSRPLVPRGGAGRELALASWGVGERRQINARADATGRRRGARCVVPADGFYEWQGSGRPIWFRASGGGLLLMAGLLEDSGAGLRFAVVTTEANDDVKDVHDRMPLILPPVAVDAWLDGLPVEAAPKPAPGLLTRTAVSKRVGSVENDDPSVLEPDAPETAAPPRQGVLFK